MLLNELMHGGPARKLLILNGVVYWLNNQMNFLVLEKVLHPYPTPSLPSRLLCLTVTLTLTLTLTLTRSTR